MTAPLNRSTGREPGASLGGLGALGLAIGTVSSACGIGGGLFAVPWLHSRAGLELKRAVATALCLVLATSVASTVTEALHAESRLDLALILATAAGALVGTQLGFLLIERLPTRPLKALFVVVFLLAGLRMLLGAGGDAGAAAEAPASWLAMYGAAAGVGFFGGLTSPLLGVGGGLILVPGLLFALPFLGFPGARATSLAVAVVTATRSLVLHARAGRVRLSLGLPLALGALAGAALGVTLVHYGVVVALAKRLLGVILVLTAVRFARELRASRSAQA
jgi:uncharacterized membrane protein YfcA